MYCQICHVIEYVANQFIWLQFQQEELQEVKQQHPSTVGPAPPSVPENTATAPIQPAPDTPTDVKKVSSLVMRW